MAKDVKKFKTTLTDLLKIDKKLTLMSNGRKQGKSNFNETFEKFEDKVNELIKMYEELEEPKEPKEQFKVDDFIEIIDKNHKLYGGRGFISRIRKDNYIEVDIYVIVTSGHLEGQRCFNRTQIKAEQLRKIEGNE